MLSPCTRCQVRPAADPDVVIAGALLHLRNARLLAERTGDADAYPGPVEFVERCLAAYRSGMCAGCSTNAGMEVSHV